MEEIAKFLHVNLEVNEIVYSDYKVKKIMLARMTLTRLIIYEINFEVFVLIKKIVNNFLN